MLQLADADPLLKENYLPFKSAKQRRFMYAKHPEIARRWSEEEKRKKKNPHLQGAKKR